MKGGDLIHGRLLSPLKASVNINCTYNVVKSHFCFGLDQMNQSTDLLSDILSHLKRTR